MRRVAMASVLLALTMPARAESVWVGGVSVADTTQVAYLGRLAPLPGQRFGDGWSYSVFADNIEYEYDKGLFVVDARARGLRVGLSRQVPIAGGSFSYGLGVQARETRLSPDDIDNHNRGSQVRAVGELQWRSSEQANWRSGFYGQYVFAARNDYAKLFVGRRLDNDIAIGPQFWTGGDPTYRVHGAGIALDGWRLGAARITAFVGAEHAEGGRTRPAVGIEFSLYRN